jgi:Zn-dependent protease/CBS domain-containing protein
MPPRQKRKRRNTVPVFHIAGIQVNLDYSWFIIFALVTWSLSAGYYPRHYEGFHAAVYWTAGTLTSLLFFLSIMLHELVHSLVAIRLGITIRSINLFFLGGTSQLSHGAKRPLDEFLIAFSGPASNLLLGGMFFGLNSSVHHIPYVPFIDAMANYLAWINVFIGLFNLVPAFPLDGGRILQAIFWWKTGSSRYAMRLSTDMGKGFSIAIVCLGALQVFTGSLIGGLILILVGLYLRNMAYAGMEGFEIRHSLENLKVSDVMTDHPDAVPPDITVEELVADYFIDSGYREFPVASDGAIEGVVSLENIFPLTVEERKTMTVRDIMVPLASETQVSPEDSLSVALRRMIGSNANNLAVMEDGKMVGLLTRTGVTRLMELRKQ